MKFSTIKEHRHFFQKHGWIEFEGFISSDQLTFANQAIDQVLAERLHVPTERLRLSSSEQFFLHGHDLWRSHQLLRKWATHTHFAEIASELIEKKPLRLGYDQLLPTYYESQFSESTQQTYAPFLQQTHSLEAVSSLQGVSCGLMLALAGKQRDHVTENLADCSNIFPSLPGQVIFFKPTLSINWNQLSSYENGRFYLIVYTQASAHYQLQTQDPHTHSLKRLGYVFNDKLNDKLHPIVYR